MSKTERIILIAHRAWYSFFLTCVLSYGIGKLWQWLETKFYGEIQVRKVDDIIFIIMMLITFAMWYMVILYWETKVRNKELINYMEGKKHEKTN